MCFITITCEGKKAVNEAAILKTIPRTNTELAIRFVAENTVEKAQQLYSNLSSTFPGPCKEGTMY